MLPSGVAPPCIESGKDRVGSDSSPPPGARLVYVTASPERIHAAENMSAISKTSCRQPYMLPSGVMRPAIAPGWPGRSRLRTCFGAFELNVARGELRKSGTAVRLRPQAAKILTLLASRPGEIIRRDQLREEIWGHHVFMDFEHGLNLCIREIRAALDDDADKPRYVETLLRIGYRLIAHCGVADRNFGVNDRIDDQCRVLGDFGECARGPIPPARIVRGDVKKDVAIHEHATACAQAGLQADDSLCHLRRVVARVSPRVSAKISSVLMRGSAVPRRTSRARCPRTLSPGGRRALRMRA